VTIIRPSHTYRKNFISAIGGGDHAAWRMLKGKPVIVHGDGTSLWTYTHSDDFAWFFARLLGKSDALNEAYNITQHVNAYPWDRLFLAMAAALGVDPELVHVPTDTLLKYRPDWIGPLTGDKTPSTMFDNSKVQKLVGDYVCKIEPEEGLRRVAEHYKKRASSFKLDEAADALFDRIASDQSKIGSAA
jgi:nucleoside-diphosphate-sugar epimerase